MVWPDWPWPAYFMTDLRHWKKTVGGNASTLKVGRRRYPSYRLQHTSEQHGGMMNVYMTWRLVYRRSRCSRLVIKVLGSSACLGVLFTAYVITGAFLFQVRWSGSGMMKCVTLQNHHDFQAIALGTLGPNNESWFLFCTIWVGEFLSWAGKTESLSFCFSAFQSRPIVASSPYQSFTGWRP